MSATDTEEMTPQSVKGMTMDWGVRDAGIDYQVVVKGLQEKEINLQEMPKILTYLAKMDSVDTRQYVGAITKWRNLTVKIKLANDELEEFN